MSGDLRPRLCLLEKSSDGYGFHLHGEKHKAGQFIRLVEPDSPAELSGLRAGDRLAFVNGESVEGESHQQVVSRIRAVTGKLELIVVDADTAEYLKNHGLTCKKEFVTDGVPGSRHQPETVAQERNGTATESSPEPEPDPDPVSASDPDPDPASDLDPNPASDPDLVPASDPVLVSAFAFAAACDPDPDSDPVPVPASNGDMGLDSLSLSSKESKNELRPRLCHMKKAATGYGFNLHSEKSKPGQYIRAVDEDSPADKSGLRPQDRVVQVNGMPVQGLQHSEVVAAIKSGGEELQLLVVDPETEAFFNSCQVIPTEAHLTGPLPELEASRDTDEKEGAVKEVKSGSVSPTPSSASSTASIPAEMTSSPPTQEKAVEKSKNANAPSSLDLNISLQQAKERAHQKRSNKKAPPMDWSKRSEVFSNL